MTQQLVHKAEYARMRGRGKSAVSNWIAAGQLEAPALVMRDGVEMIDVEIADAMLAARLDQSQQLAQSSPMTGAPLDDDDDVKAGPGLAPEQREYLQLKVDEKKIAVERGRRALLAETGRYVEAADVERVWAREAAAMISEFEAWVYAYAQEFADEHNLDAAAVKLQARNSFNAFRARQANVKRGSELPQAAE
jgi:hypothetical protein